MSCDQKESLQSYNTFNEYDDDIYQQLKLNADALPDLQFSSGKVLSLKPTISMTSGSPWFYMCLYYQNHQDDFALLRFLRQKCDQNMSNVTHNNQYL